jgi:hypothetical protein
LGQCLEPDNVLKKEINQPLFNTSINLPVKGLLRKDVTVSLVTMLLSGEYCAILQT